MKKKKQKQKKEDYKIINDYNHDIEIIKKIIKTVNIFEYRIKNESIDYSCIEDKLRKIGFKVERFNVNKLVKSDISHEFLVVELLDDIDKIKILIDLDFIIFYPYSSISQDSITWVGNNMLSMYDSLKILNNLIVMGYIPYKDNFEAYLNCFSRNEDKSNVKIKKI